MRRPVPLAPRPLRRLVEAMPKAELHLHLDGSLRVDTALELARTRGVDAPRTFAEMYDALVAPERTASQAELLERFDLPIALLQDAEALERVTAELVEVKAADGVRYVEIRWGPALHTQRGLSLVDGIAAVCRGAAQAALRTGIVARLICTALRSHDVALNIELAEAAGRFRGQGLVGWDLAGQEERFPDPSPFERAFASARAGGLRITLHAGEWGGAAQVRRALALRPERIAHGPLAVDDPTLVAELIDRGVTLDLCPTSNVQAGIVASVDEHPLARLHRAGVSVTLSTDDATVSDIDLSEEYLRALERIGLSLSELWAIDRRALDVAFAEPAILAPLRAEFDAWAALVPELRPAGVADA
jgi:adenosine deaminase